MAKGKSRKLSGPGKRRGAPDHFTGHKLDFLTSKATLYHQATDSPNISLFYDDVTDAFLQKFGWEEPFSKEPTDVPEGLIDPAQVDVTDVDVPARAPLTQTEAQAVHDKLRVVSRNRSSLVVQAHIPHSDLFIETWSMVPAGVFASRSSQKIEGSLGLCSSRRFRFGRPRSSR